MEYLVVGAVAFLMSGITLLSGFGLGTVLMPAFALFFGVPVAIAATAVVHLANSVFKLGLVGRQADWAVVRRFGVPAAAAALAGAGALSLVADLPPLGGYRLGGREFQVTAVKTTIGALIIAFVWLETSGRLERLGVSGRHLVVGGCCRDSSGACPATRARSGRGSGSPPASTSAPSSGPASSAPWSWTSPDWRSTACRGSARENPGCRGRSWA
jgi:hypothetical protein